MVKLVQLQIYDVDMLLLYLHLNALSVHLKTTTFTLAVDYPAFRDDLRMGTVWWLKLASRVMECPISSQIEF